MTRGRGGGRSGGRGGGPRAHLFDSSDSPHPSTESSYTPGSIPGGISSSNLETLKSIMAQLDTPTSSSTSFAQAGNVVNFASALHAHSLPPGSLTPGPQII